MSVSHYAHVMRNITRYPSYLDSEISFPPSVKV